MGAGPPSSFKVIVEPDTTISIDPEEIWRAAITVMFRVTDFPLTDTWHEQSFPSPIGSTEIRLWDNTFGKERSYLTSQHVIWGLNRLMLSMFLSKQYCRTVAKISWAGEVIGTITVTPVAPGRPQRSAPDMQAERPAPMTPTSTESGFSHFFDRDVRVGVTYGSKSINKQLIYLTAIKAMGDAAERGLDTPVPYMITPGIQKVTWKLLRIRPVGSPLPDFKAGHSRMAIYRVIELLLHNQMFMETYVILSVIGEKYAIGGFDQEV
ncbi:MAG: hypothetical protein Q9223_003023 [Gallowayella weberi]